MRRNKIIVYGSEPTTIATNPENVLSCIYTKDTTPILFKRIKPGYWDWNGTDFVPMSTKQRYLFKVVYNSPNRQGFSVKLKRFLHYFVILGIGMYKQAIIEWNREADPKEFGGDIC